MSKGLTLIELLVVMMIVAILAAVAIPSFQDIKINNELSVAQEDLAQMLRKARSLAQSRSTFASVTLTQSTPPTAVLTLQDGSEVIRGSASETLTLPASVSLSAAPIFRFNTTGNTVGASTIVLSSSATNTAIDRTINLSALGSVEIIRN